MSDSIKSRLFGSVLLSEPDDVHRYSPELERFWLWYEAHVMSRPKTKTNHCKRFVLSFEKRLSRTKDLNRRRQILAGLAAARSTLGMELYPTDNAESLTILEQAAVEARESRHPQTAYNALQVLGIFYERNGLVELAEIVYMQSTAYAAFLGPQMSGLLLDRLSNARRRSRMPEVAAWLEQWESTFSTMPLQLLINRANKLAQAGFESLLTDEAERPAIYSCWHLGRSFAACKALFRDGDAAERKRDGLSLARSQEDVYWLRAFEDVPE